MKKLSFYSHLSLANLWRNRNTYGPYMLACVVSIFTFYTMLSISLNGALNGMRGEAIVKSFAAVGTVILAVFCGILIFYTNSFLIKRRKKELGLYSVLGMEKKNIAVLMLFETLFTTIVALALGLILGMLLSQLLFWALLRMVRFPVVLFMPVSPAAVSITTALFCVVFTLTLLRNLRQVHTANPVELMAGAKQGEKEPKASWLLTVIGLLCLIGGYVIALYFTSPVDALMFFLVAVALVIIGTFCLFTSGSVALLKLLRKNKTFYYKPGHFISLSGMIYRMKQNASGLAAICILSCMVLVTVASTVSLNVGAEDSLRTQYPFEYELLFNKPEDADIALTGLMDIAEEGGVAIIGLQDYQRAVFSAYEQDDAFAGDFKPSGMAMGNINMIELLLLDDYNRNEGLDVTLNEGQALLFVTGGKYDKDEITVNGVCLQITQIKTLDGQKAGTADTGRTLTLVLPDESTANEILNAVRNNYAMSRKLAFDLDGNDGLKQLFYKNYNAFVGNLITEALFQSRVRNDMRTDWYTMNGGFLFLGVYFGILFMLAAALIIYYKQMSEGYDDAVRFEIMQKVGMSEDEVRKTINRQILMVFFLPLVVAILHVTVAFFPISRAMVIFGVHNVALLAVAGLSTVLAYALVYLIVFRRTARVYFGIVRRKPVSS